MLPPEFNMVFKFKGVAILKLNAPTSDVIS
jgi:hypothetical protein